MSSNQVLSVIKALNYADTDGLVTSGSRDLSPSRAYIWEELQQKFKFDAVYFHGNVPAVYFKGFETASNEELLRLHRHLWNHNSAPLLIAVMPDEVRIYNCFAPPEQQAQEEANRPLLKLIRLATDAVNLRNSLSPYSREQLESGRLHLLFDRNHRVDRRLLVNLSDVRSRLLNGGLSKHVANALLARSIFVRYLEDRQVLTPSFLLDEFGALNYTSILRSREKTYELFSFLSTKFNGDIFPIDSKELSEVSDAHLQQLSSFLAGSEVGTGQSYFWAYDFEYIPIELVSSIYEEFLYLHQKDTGAYYTPPEVVHFVLNELMPWDDSGRELTILDPACGSGIFLVEAYRRLVFRARRQSDGELGFERLRDILIRSIYGVDIDPDAVRVAVFSCYLALLDFLSPKSIWNEVSFPKMIGENFQIADFFDSTSSFTARRYDIVVGNPPWGSMLAPLAKHYIKDRGHVIGDNQLAQAFLWRAADFVRGSGQICMLAPSKGILFNRSKSNIEFRSRFMESFTVTLVVDFSLFRHELFLNATAPMAAVFYHTLSDASRLNDSRVVYCTPRPSRLASSLAGVVLSGDEVRRFQREQLLQYPDLWKIALWGTSRDFFFVNELRRLWPTLGEVAQARDWVIGEGVQVGGGDRRYAPNYNEITYVPTRAIQPFRITGTRDQRIGTTYFHRTRNPKLFEGPHVLLKEGILRGGIIAAAFVPYSAVFRDKVVGIAASESSERELKALTGVLNSSLARYFQFLTSAGWGVERDALQLNDHLALPFPFPSGEEEHLTPLADLVDKIQATTASDYDWQGELDDLVFAAYGIAANEVQLVRDTLHFSLDQFVEGTRSHAFAPASDQDLRNYGHAFAQVINASIESSGQQFRPYLTGNVSDYGVMSFSLESSEAVSAVEHSTPDSDFDETLSLWASANRRMEDGIYLQRNLKIFEDRAVHVIKPSERRFWSVSTAYNDADETIAQIMGGGR